MQVSGQVAGNTGQFESEVLTRTMCLILESDMAKIETATGRLNDRSHNSRRRLSGRKIELHVGFDQSLTKAVCAHCTRLQSSAFGPSIGLNRRALSAAGGDAADAKRATAVNPLPAHTVSCDSADLALANRSQKVIGNGNRESQSQRGAIASHVVVCSPFLELGHDATQRTRASPLHHPRHT